MSKYKRLSIKRPSLAQEAEGCVQPIERPLSLEAEHQAVTWCGLARFSSPVHSLRLAKTFGPTSRPFRDPLHCPQQYPGNRLFDMPKSLKQSAATRPSICLQLIHQHGCGHSKIDEIHCAASKSEICHTIKSRVVKDEEVYIMVLQAL